MPRSWQYPRLRRILIPTIMWLVLAGAVALAAFVSQQRNASNHITLSNHLTLGPLSVSLPSNWIVLPDNNDQYLSAREPRDSDQNRTLIIQYLPASPSTTLEQILTVNTPNQPPLPPQDEVPNLDIPEFSPQPQPITIANSPGLFKRCLQIHFSPTSDQPFNELFLATTLLPNHHAILIRLTAPPDADDDNTQLLQNLAANITLTK